MNEQPADNVYASPSEVILDSRTIELNRYFDEKGALPQLLVLVEDNDDKTFWFNVFSTCVGQYYSSVDVWPLKEAAEKEQPQTDASGVTLTATGKDALMRVAGLGRNKMVAVDADYDLLIDNFHSYTNRIRSGKYVQHTTYYSIENHLLDNTVFTALPELSALCAAVEDYVYGIIGEEITHIQEVANSSHHIHALTTDRLRSALGSLNYRPATYRQDIESLTSKRLGTINPKALPQYQAAKKSCNSSGYDAHNLWKIIQGHTLYEFMEKVISYKKCNERRIQESIITNDASIPNDEKPSKISELKYTLLGDCKNETEKFHKDVYSCQFLNIASPIIKDIQRKILDDIS